MKRLLYLESRPYTLEKYKDLILAPHVAYKGIYKCEKKNEIKRAITKIYDIAYESKIMTPYSALSKAYTGELEGVPQVLVDNPLWLHLAIDFICTEEDKVKELCLKHVHKDDIRLAHEKALIYIRKYVDSIYALPSANRNNTKH